MSMDDFQDIIDRNGDEAVRMARRVASRLKGVCSDDNVAPARVGNVYICTLRDNHEGDHEAQGLGSRVIATWKRGEGRA